MMIRVDHTKKLHAIEKLFIAVTEWVGTTQSIFVHTILFILCFSLYFFGIKFSQILLILTTVVSLEAIYLSLFIQMTVTRNTESLEDVEEDIEEIQEDVEGIEGDVEGLEGNIKHIHANVRDLEADVEDISEDIDRIQVDDDHENTAEELAHIRSGRSMQNIEKELITLSKGIIALKDDLEVLKKNLK